MKNKLTYIIATLIASVSFLNTSFANMAFISGPEAVIESAEQVTDFEIDVACSITDSYRYFSVGVGPIVFIPNLGIGYRERYAQYGWDTGASFSTIGYAHQLTAHVVGHYYLDDSRQNSPYVGLGIMGSGIFTNRNGSSATISPLFVFGKEFTKEECSRHFLEMQVAIPTFWTHRKHHCSNYIPLMYIKYGISF